MAVWSTPAAMSNLFVIYLFDYTKNIFQKNIIFLQGKNKLWMFPVSKTKDAYTYDLGENCQWFKNAENISSKV